MLGEALFEMYGLAKTFSIEKQTMCARRYRGHHWRIVLNRTQARLCLQ